MPDLPTRRQLLGATALGVAGLALLKVGGRAVMGVAPPAMPTPDLKHIGARHAAIFTAAALAMLGPEASAAYATGRWSPLPGIDTALDGLAPDQRKTLGVGVLLFEEWTPGLRGFSLQTPERQQAWLAGFRDSDLPLQRSIWGFLHAVSASSFSTHAAGWASMGYPGPCIGVPGRAPGQSVPFTWDEAVP